MSTSALHGGVGLSRLERDSPLDPIGPSSFETEISAGWCSGIAPNGGYLLSVVLRAMGHVLPLPDPLTATAHYIRQPLIGPARIDVETLRVGRSIARGVARFSQDGEERMRVMAAFGTLPVDPSPALYSASPLELAPIEECDALVLGTPDGGPSSVRERFDVRYDPNSVGWARRKPTGRPEMRAWLRAADGTEPDHHLLAVVADALPSTAFDLGVESWVPTIELTVHQRAVPAPGWLRCGWSSRLASAGLIEEDGEIWDSSGRLVAMSRQLAMLPRPSQKGTDK